MKIRNGFVSNSSTTSFCIYGAWVEVPQEIYDKYDGDLFDWGAEYGLSVYYNSESHDVAIGISPDNIKDDETGAQFKERVKNKIREALVQDVECCWLEEVWYE